MSKHSHRTRRKLNHLRMLVWSQAIEPHNDNWTRAYYLRAYFLLTNLRNSLTE